MVPMRSANATAPSGHEVGEILRAHPQAGNPLGQTVSLLLSADPYRQTNERDRRCLRPVVPTSPPIGPSGRRYPLPVPVARYPLSSGIRIGWLQPGTRGGLAMTTTPLDQTSFVVNGEAASVRSDHPHLLAALREELDITSPKDGCSPSGQCGACTVLLDGKAIQSCLVGMEKAAGQGGRDPGGLPGRRPGPPRQCFRRGRCPAVRILHPGHHGADPGAARPEGQGPHPGDGRRPPRRPPVPVHRLHEDLRGHRDAADRLDPRRRPAGRGRNSWRQVRGGRAGPRRPRLRRRHAARGACCTAPSS